MPYTAWNDGHERTFPWFADVQGTGTCDAPGYRVVVADAAGLVVARSGVYPTADAAALALRGACHDALGGFPDTADAPGGYIGCVEWREGFSLVTEPFKDRDAAGRVALKLSFGDFKYASP